MTVPVVPQAFQQQFDDMNSRDGVPLDFNAQMTLRVTDSARMIRDFGTDLASSTATTWRRSSRA